MVPLKGRACMSQPNRFLVELEVVNENGGAGEGPDMVGVAGGGAEIFMNVPTATEILQKMANGSMQVHPSRLPVQKKDIITAMYNIQKELHFGRGQTGKWNEECWCRLAATLSKPKRPSAQVVVPYLLSLPSAPITQPQLLALTSASSTQPHIPAQNTSADDESSNSNSSGSSDDSDSSDSSPEKVQEDAGAQGAAMAQLSSAEKVQEDAGAQGAAMAQLSSNPPDAGAPNTVAPQPSSNPPDAGAPKTVAPQPSSNPPAMDDEDDFGPPTGWDDSSDDASGEVECTSATQLIYEKNMLIEKQQEEIAELVARGEDYEGKISTLICTIYIFFLF